MLATAYPFLVASGETLRGPYIGEDMLARSPFGFDPWLAYAAGVVRSHSAAIIGVKGTGKSMLAKSWACGLMRMGRRVAVPHDPNGEWGRVAEFVDGKTVSVGRSRRTRINLLDPGERDAVLSEEDWRADVLQFRRGTMKTVMSQLRAMAPMTPFEHTTIDLVLTDLAHHDTVVLPMVYDRLRRVEEWTGDEDVRHAARVLAHTVRLVVEGELQGLFDGESTVTFDASAPMMVVDTSALKGASPEAKALLRLATSNWIKRSTSGSHRHPRVIVHEEAAVELLNDVTGGGAGGLTEKVAGEKVARHDGVSNWYLLHRIADLDALGDRGSALHSQALGLLADCDTRISYAQHEGELDRSQEVLGWNSTMRRIVRRLEKGEGLWQIGPDRIAKVKNIMTPGMEQVFKTDTAGGERA
ncbi:hypothetical protein OVA26_17140 [Microbacterium sp. SL62]|uniref:hypothetical protein n=1 Tax=Microbacterium sp. SL62 TaxID=2995139 RepID=UPI002274FB64|nr:hypothetical protein [Microbacterium sp. SL62]MCY1718664.1 hypothetical protein [Microbacterium sp. SL62]